VKLTADQLGAWRMQERFRDRVRVDDAPFCGVDPHDGDRGVVDGASIARLLLEQHLFASFDEEIRDVQQPLLQLLREQPCQPGRDARGRARTRARARPRAAA
jgi:hypothetical protein